MKKLYGVLASLFFILALGGCGEDNGHADPDAYDPEFICLTDPENCDRIRCIQFEPYGAGDVECNWPDYQVGG